LGSQVHLAQRQRGRQHRVLNGRRGAVTPGQVLQSLGRDIVDIARPGRVRTARTPNAPTPRCDRSRPGATRRGPLSTLPTPRRRRPEIG
jgi:hypothetical protein